MVEVLVEAASIQAVSLNGKPGKPGQIYLIVDFADGRTTWAADNSGDSMKLPQFNGYLYSATMSPKEYPNDETKKTL